MMKNDIERLLEGKEAVIFDVDGTLIDSMGVWEEVDRIYLTRHGKTDVRGFAAQTGGA